MQTIMRSIPTSFYKTKRWEKCRAAYLSEHPYCERCLAQGLVVPAAHVHHKQHLTLDNYKDPEIAYGPDNLEALCVTCHNQEHHTGVFIPRQKVKKDVRPGLYFDSEGNLRKVGEVPQGGIEND